MRKRTWWRLYCAIFLVSLIWIAFFGAYSGLHYDPGANEADSEQNKEPPNEGFWERTTTDPIALFTALLVLFNAILAVATVRLWRSTEALVISSEKTSKRQLRAYVVLDTVEASATMLSGKRVWNFSLKWINRGPTPTRRLFIFAKGMRFRPAVSAEEDVSFPAIGERHCTRTMLGPNSIMLSASEPIEHDIVLKMSRENWRFFMWGIAKYNDIFDIPHTTMICTRIDLRSVEWNNVPVGAKVGCTAWVYKRWNAADEECERYENELATLPALEW